MQQWATRKRLLIVAVLVCVVTASGYYWYRRSAAAATLKAQNSGFAIGQVKRGDLEVSVNAQGHLEMSTERDVLTKSGGTVDVLSVAEGDTVTAGQMIARLSNPSLENQVEKLEIDLETLQNQLNDLLNPARETVRKSELALEQAQLDLQAKRLDQERLSVTAPISGTVQSVSVETGDEVTRGEAVCTIQDDDSLALIAPLDQYQINRVAVGDKVSITFQSLKATGDYHRLGVISEIGQTATPSGKTSVVDVTVKLESTDGIMSGMTGVALFRLSTGTTVTSRGTVKALSSTTVTTKVAGEVASVGVEVGDRVSSGDVLFKLTSDSIDLAVLQAENAVEIARKSYESLTTKTEEDSQVRDLRLRVQQAQSNLDRAREDVENLTIVSPVTGVVLSTNVNAGDTVNGYTKIATVAEIGKMAVDISVDELDIVKVSLGQEATIAVSALPDKEFKGKVVSISPKGVASSGVATFAVTVLVTDPAGLLAGMTADVTIVTERKTDVLIAPAEAIVSKNNQHTAIVVSPDGTKTPTKVEIGSTDGTYTEILSGLKEGDSVVLASVSGNSQMGGMMFFGPGGGNAPRGGPVTNTTVQRRP
ncbi:MAG: efflux RND transporter periplasmic adaptor subunit [Bacillota bacterium]